MDEQRHPSAQGAGDQFQAREAAQDQGTEGANPRLPPPELPSGYLATGTPRYLGEQQWITLASHQSKGDGVLMYKGEQGLCFLISEGAITALYSLLEWGVELFMDCSPAYTSSPQHEEGIRKVRLCLWAIETARARQMASQRSGEQDHLETGEK